MYANVSKCISVQNSSTKSSAGDYQQSVIIKNDEVVTQATGNQIQGATAAAADDESTDCTGNVFSVYQA